jgi:uncharacterized membrane protein YfcA
MLVVCGWEPSLQSLTFDAASIVIGLAVLAAGFLRGFVGFGAALITIPVLSLTMSPVEAVTISALISLPATFQLLPTAVRHAERSIVLPIGLAVFFATPFGVWLLVSIDTAIMKITISTLVMIMIVLLGSGWRLSGHIGKPLLIGAGVTGGVVQGVAGVGGPPVVAVILSRPGGGFGLFSEKVLLASVLLLPLYSLSTWLGMRFFTREGQRFYRRAALTTLAVIAITSFVFSVRDYLSA